MNLGGTRQYLLLGAAVVCIAGLYLAAMATEPDAISLVDLAEHEGEAVQVTGLIVHVERYDRAASFVLRDENVSARVFSPEGLAARQGDRVRVTGTVQRYQGQLEIVAENVTVLEYASSIVPVPVLAEHYTDYLDVTVTANGSAVDVTSDSFHLQDDGCSIEVRHPDRMVNVSAGEDITVTAVLRYDTDVMCFYLSIERSTHMVERRG